VPIEAEIKWCDNSKKWHVVVANMPNLAAMSDIYNRTNGDEILPVESKAG